MARDPQQSFATQLAALAEKIRVRIFISFTGKMWFKCGFSDIIFEPASDFLIF